jgi:integrase
MPEKMNFTRKALDALQAGEKLYYVYDTKVRGLALYVTPAGRKTFVLYRKADNKPVKIRIGPFEDLSIEQARTKAEELNNQIALGNSPQEKAREKRQELTFGDFFAVYIERHAKPYKRTWKFDLDIYRLHLEAPLASRKLSAITRGDIQELHARIGAGSGHACANRVLDTVLSIFGKAIEWDYLKGSNPATVKRFRLQSRERFLTPAELPRFFEALAQEGNSTLRDYILLSLLTGARRGNVVAMRWDEIDLSRTLWRIPMTKNGEAQTVVLATEAVEILKRRKDEVDDSPWVFPSDSASGHLIDPKKSWKRLLERSGLKDLRIHDLRRTLGSWQAAQGANGYIIGKSLGHKSSRATEIYARLNLDPVRDSVEKATAAMMQHVPRSGEQPLSMRQEEPS